MTDAPKTTDDQAVIVPTVGPYTGQRLTMPKADAKAAIADGWAIDPNAPAPTEPKEKPKEMTEEQRAEIKAKAEKAMRKLRGEPEPEVQPEPATTRDMSPEPGAPYQTRSAPKK